MSTFQLTNGLMFVKPEDESEPKFKRNRNAERQARARKQIEAINDQRRLERETNYLEYES